MLVGVRGGLDEHSIAVDAAGGNCRIVVPDIPNGTTTAPSTTAAATTEVSYDITGMGAGPWQNLISAAPAAGARHALGVRLRLLCTLLLALSMASPLVRSRLREGEGPS